MDEPRWITLEAAILLHEFQIAEFGGSDGVRDVGLLDSAMTRPRNLFLYELDVPLSRLAASYCYGISRNHPFVDGNKRVAYVVARTFLQKNGHDIVASPAEKIKAMLALASGQMPEDELVHWFAEHFVSL
ncbi:MAG: type II toxin-antitoxin system death-on-curing family toxin [Candidatus Hydrogenedentes bacterium]|nr:type II toxin-antitoxin system death-on-curing family toxin [Candidatus Hydrogenedentota bacterium]